MVFLYISVLIKLFYVVHISKECLFQHFSSQCLYCMYINICVAHLYWVSLFLWGFLYGADFKFMPLFYTNFYLGHTLCTFHINVHCVPKIIFLILVFIDFEKYLYALMFCSSPIYISVFNMSTVYGSSK